MSERQRCPHCTEPLNLPQTQGMAVSREVVDSLLEEMQQLRETIAMLRGVGAGRTGRPPGAADPESARMRATV